MASNFHIYSFNTQNSLHLKLEGDFDRNSAYDLINKLAKYNKDLNSIHPFGREVFQKKLGALKNQFLGITFMGRNGNEILAY